MKRRAKIIIQFVKGKEEEKKLHPLICRVFLALLLFTLTVGFILFDHAAPAFAKLYINEFMADNKSMIQDPAEPDSYEDWIEIYNSGTSSINMAGMYLTDDLANPTQWQVPVGVTIPAGGYLIFWADDDESQGSTHTNFKLASGGEQIGLFKADGETPEDSVTFGAQLVDVSYGRYPNGTASWGFMAGTPGGANSPHNAPPAITGTTRFPLTPAVNDAVWVTCTVNDDGTVTGVTLTYDAGSGPQNIPMYDDGAHNDGGSNDGFFGAQIPSFAKDTVVQYYISATDNLGAQFRDPANAPSDTHHYIVGYEPPQLFINEFMADNDSIIQDPQEAGCFEDWIEIYNPTGSAVNMAGMYLTDDSNNPTQWQVPEGVIIQAGGYLLFWADNDEGQGDTHTNFKLSAAGGEKISLSGADGVSLIDAIAFDAQLTDLSYGRYPDGTAAWGFMAGTPGAANSQHNAPPAITGTTHSPLIPMEYDPVWVTCMVTDDGAVAEVTLTYNAGGGPVNISMSDNGNNNDGGSNDGLFGAQIQPFAKDTIVDYFINATDNDGTAITDPVTALSGTTYYYIVGYEPPTLTINEFMADNESTIEDPDNPNSYEDWIEIYNSGNSTVAIGGMYLSDNFDNPTKWRIPDGITIQSGDYMLFWADNEEEQGAATHTGFKLSKAGGEVGLFDVNAKRNMPIDTIIFGEQPTDYSWGKISDGNKPWVLSGNATPGYANVFPLGTHLFMWTVSPGWSSFIVIEQIGDAVRSITQINEASDKCESTYLLWGKQAGNNFFIEPHQSYIMSITSPCSFSF